MNRNKIVMLGFPDEQIARWGARSVNNHEYHYYASRPISERPEVVAAVWGYNDGPKYLSFWSVDPKLPICDQSVDQAPVLTEPIEVESPLLAACHIYDVCRKILSGEIIVPPPRNLGR